MRLIDADQIITEMDAYVGHDPKIIKGIRFATELINRTPTAFNKEKVMEEIKEYREDAEDWARKPIENAEEFQIHSDAYNRCLRIIEEGGIE